jgi:hypothetical protein
VTVRVLKLKPRGLSVTPHVLSLKPCALSFKA